MRISHACSAAFFSLTLAATGTSAHALSLASVLHLHSHLSAGSGPTAELHIHNPNVTFRDVRVDGHVYTVGSKRDLHITAPVGTPIYAASAMFHRHAKGALLAQVERGKPTLDLD